ncbi:hypothetical protein LSH36_1533g00006 [Paralvinella palmiformis]|uniref:C-type lectin domain-containing protein n=1 Tax=Paralvinella palmiformis TaxID=53620 RepID=A0AAD9ISW9_9ANNE|nr:hypothetical protein LSH36_1533g00006 [Paralvinella palmiformis]
MDTILRMSGGNIWLGMYRPSTSEILDDIRYYSDGSRIAYQNWFRTDPNNSGKKENCVMAFVTRSNQWGDVRCSNRDDLICQL